MEMSPAEKQLPKRKHRWFQLRLRTLLVLVTLASATIGWVVVELEQRRGEVPAIAWAEANYCYVDFSARGTRNWWESIEDSLFGDSVRDFMCTSGRRGSSDLTELSRLAYFKNLKFLGIGGQSQVSDLSPLAELKNLEELNFDSTPVNDLSPLAGLKKLRTLTLGYTQVSDLTPLVDLKNLRYVWLLQSELSKEQFDQMKLKNRRVRLLAPY